MSVLLWVLAITLVLGLLVFVLPIVILAIVKTTPDGVSVEIAAPTRIASTTAFEIRVNVCNELDKTRLLHSVDLDDTLLNGLDIEALDPEPTDRTSMLGTTAFHFQRSILPNSSFSLALRARAKTPGEYSGTIRAFVDSKDVKSQDAVVSIVVE
ncbi:MAG: hypothetical protein KF805_06845 [Phycisphaeraceae bacterium]|nr:hypothetical protein [Phycisphaeraceae bacterium]